MKTSGFFARFIAVWLVISMLAQSFLISPVRVLADPPEDPPADPVDPPADPPPPTDPRPMDFPPPPDANTFHDLLPPGAVVITTAADVAYPGINPRHVALFNLLYGGNYPTDVELPPEAADNAQSDTALPLGPHYGLSFNNDLVGVVIENDTFTGTTGLEFTLLAQDDQILPEVGDTEPTTDTVHYVEDAAFLAFQLDVVDPATDQDYDGFDKYVRLAIDLRPMGMDIPDGGSLYLAYRDEESGDWIDVPITVHDPAGFFSAEVAHFSNWSTGWRPDGWVLDWQPPSADGFTGSSNYGYPFELPPGRNGLQPRLGFSYSNGAMNGAIRRVNLGPIASGWSMNEIAIIRTNVGLKTVYSLDLPDTFRLVINGTGHQLVTSTLTVNGGSLFYARNAPSLRVLQYDTGGGEFFWVVQTGDGTHYRLGSTATSTTTLNLITNDEDKGEGVTEWHVDTVTDPFGNQILYEYSNSSVTNYVSFITGCPGGGWCVVEEKTYGSQITDIYYNFDTTISAGELPPTSTVSRLSPASDDPASHIVFTYTNPYLSELGVFHNSTSPIREYKFTASNQQVENPGCENGQSTRFSTTRVLDSVVEYGWDGNTGTRYNLPPVEFDYITRTNYFDGSDGCFIFMHLSTVENNYGAESTFGYDSDDRSQGTYVNTGSGPTSYPDIGFSHYITELLHTDGFNNTSRITFDRQTPCYNQTNSGVLQCELPDAPEYGPLAGFDEVWATYYAADQTTAVRRVFMSYHQDADKFGRIAVQQVGEPTAGTTDELTPWSHTITSYEENETFGGDEDVPFIFVDEVKNYEYTNYGDPGQKTVSSKVTYEYNTSYQKDEEGDGTQFGNRTHVHYFADAADTYPYLTKRTWYAGKTDDGYWVVSLPSKSATYEISGTVETQQSGSYIYYDGSGDMNAPPTQGTVSRSSAFVPFDCQNEWLARTGQSPDQDCDKGRELIESVFTYDSFGNVTQTVGFQDYGYIGFSSSYQITDRITPTQQLATSIDYDSGYSLYPTQVTNALDQETRFEVYGFGSTVDGFQSHTGLLKRVRQDADTTDDGLIWSFYEYDPFGRLFAVYVDSGSRGTTTAPFDGDPVTRYRYYDNTWNSTSVQKDPANDKPFVIKVESRPDSFTSGSEGYQFDTVTYYDGLGRPVQSQDRWLEVDGEANRQDRITTTAYDALGQTICTTTPYITDTLTIRGAGPSGSGYLTTPCDDGSLTHTSFDYDLLGRVITTTTPSGAETVHVYFLIDHITVDGETALSVDKVIDANGHGTAYISNSRGQLVLTREYTGTVSHTGYADTRYTYDYAGNLITVTTSTASNSQPATWLRQTNLWYDGFGRKVQMNDPDMGVWTYFYDAAGNLVAQQDALDMWQCFYYDELNRMTHKSKEDGSACPTNPPTGVDLLAAYTYDGATNGIGRPEKVSWGTNPNNNYETYSYDTKGRVISTTRVLDGNGYTMLANEFDVLNRPLELTYPNGVTVAIGYDREGEETLTLDGTDLVETITYNGRGQMVSLDRGNGVVTDYSYYGTTGDFRLNQAWTHKGLNTHMTFSYTYDDVGNILAITEAIANDTQTFTYDPLGRLQTAEATGGSGSDDYDHTYYYDELGNITQVDRDGDEWDYSYPGTNQPHAVAAIDKPIGHGQTDDLFDFGYDANGNMITRTDHIVGVVYTQTFDVANRLVQVTQDITDTVTAFAYDAGEQRVKTTITVSETKSITYYPFPGYEVELKQEWLPCEGLCGEEGYVWTTVTTTQRSTYSLAGQAIALQVTSSPTETNDGLYYIHTDHLGSSSYLSDSSGNKLIPTVARYLPFGEYRAEPSAELTDRGFTGHRHNDSLELIYMNARFYLPGVGRFVSADIIVPDFANPQSFNRYSYVLNRPHVFIDPSGHCYILLDGETCEPIPPPQGNGIPDPIFNYPCTPSGNAVCITPNDDPIDMITHVVFGEGGSIDQGIAANVLQALLNRAWNYWTCETCGYNPAKIPWEDITSEQLTALLLYIASQPYTDQYGNQQAAFNAWNAPYERGKGSWNDIRAAVIDIINSAGQNPVSVGGIAPDTAVSGNRAVIYYGAGPMLAAPPGAVAHDSYNVGYHDGPWDKEDRQLIVTITWYQYYGTQPINPATWVPLEFRKFWDIKLYWEE